MPAIEIIDTGRIDNRDSAFPQAVQRSNGDILCSFSVGGGPNATGHTDVARSTDNGRTWTLIGPVMESTKDPWSTNCLRISRAPDSDVLYAYGSKSFRRSGQFGEGMNQPVFCQSTDGGQTWSEPGIVPVDADCALEISYAAMPLHTGRLLAPAATLPSKARLGERVLVAISDDGGTSWPRCATVFRDPEKQFGYFEHKFCEFAPDHVMAVCWSVTLGDVQDRENQFTISTDGGLTWGPEHSTGIMGQTMTPIPLGDNRLLVLYNRRYGHQGIVMSLVTFDDHSWKVHHEDLMYDAQSERRRPKGEPFGVNEFDSFAFGFPTAIRLQDGTFLATHWSREAGAFGIRWTRLRVDG